MTRDHHHVATPTSSTAGIGTDQAHKAYSLRQFVAYRTLIERRQRRDPERVVDDYAREHPEVDLDARTTFAEWRMGMLPGDTAVRPGALVD